MLHGAALVGKTLLNGGVSFWRAILLTGWRGFAVPTRLHHAKNYNKTPP
jgi:hypothetical protein